jgi:sulfoxide reductase heme-binding subunit YedZ
MNTATFRKASGARAGLRQRRLLRRLLRHHLPIAICVGAGLGAGVLLLTPPSGAVRLTIASAYLALALLAATLLVSPIAALRGRPAPASSDLRRDLGIWTGALSLVHVGCGLWARFGEGAYRTDGWWAVALAAGAVLAGVAATEITLVLLALSNDRALRRLGLPRWKRLQRLALWLPDLAVIHGTLWLALAGRGLLAACALAALAYGPRLVRALASSARRQPAQQR